MIQFGDTPPSTIRHTPPRPLFINRRPHNTDTTSDPSFPKTKTVVGRGGRRRKTVVGGGVFESRWWGRWLVGRRCRMIHIWNRLFVLTDRKRHTDLEQVFKNNKQCLFHPQIMNYVRFVELTFAEKHCAGGPDGAGSAGDLCFIPGGAGLGGGDFFTDDALISPPSCVG
ncbi:hypothetical protein HanRHA438_Chr02g0083131 [Helianthus annuus]|nr:hypothetical protein HanRHA438_Chr02g0083131 [Helianthus annuus]